ncbi:myosin-2 heavy chain-like [Odontomachus brunneus]|uniref:myosin-2 heavy chain-like n=1 Tax=Odontomachus brunneus TaxID=486640 RepID=UPI0013F1F9F5|nr:myosin-2 heavy chain-like [Odontomachus brunneus]
MQGDSSGHHSPYEDCSNGISSNNNSARRPTVKTSAAATSNKKPSVAADKRQLEIQFSTKKARYAVLKKTLADKEKLAQDLLEEMSSLREKIIAAGGKDPGKIEDPRSFLVNGLKQRSPTPPIEMGSSQDLTEKRLLTISVNESAVIGVSLLQNQLQDLCDHSRELCQRALDRSSSFASLVKSWLTESSRHEAGNALAPLDSEIEAQLAIFGQDNEDMRTRLNELAAIQKDLVAELAKRSSSLSSEYNYHGRAEEPPSADRKNLLQQLNTALEELKAERDKANHGKNKTKMMELQMQKARAKIRELEGHVVNEEEKLQQLQSSVKSLETQLKQKDVVMEERMKDMHKALKSSENLVSKIEKQRDTLETRILELKEQMACKEAEASATIKELSERFETIDVEINEERNKRQQAENTLVEMEERCKNLEEKSQLLCDLASEKSNNLVVADNYHTENEVHLYNDLKAARTELEKQQRRIEQLEIEKQEIVAVMHQAASRDSEDKTNDKLATELVAKTEELQNLMLENDFLRKEVEFAERKKDELEKQLSEIQHHLHAKSKEDGKTGLDAIDLQQQVSDLRNSLVQVIQQNQELETSLTQKQLELEQRDRVMREQSKFLKARNELLTILKGKQQTSVDNLPNENYEDMDEVNKQIATKTEAIQELYATLESKQMQVMRLEKLVKLLEDQQDRAQAQRTRLEHRIAQLEVSLRDKTKNSNRYVTSECNLRKSDRSYVIDDRVSRALPRESKRALLEEPTPTFRLINPRPRKRLGFPRYLYRRVLPSKSLNPPPSSIAASYRSKSAKFHVDDWCRACSDNEEAFICERCRRETGEKFKDDTVRQVERDRHDPMRKSLYEWLMRSSTLESGTTDDNADCFFRIVNPDVVRGIEPSASCKKSLYSSAHST